MADKPKKPRSPAQQEATRKMIEARKAKYGKKEWDSQDARKAAQ